MECEKRNKCKVDRKTLSSKSQTGYDIIVSMKKNIEKNDLYTFCSYF